MSEPPSRLTLAQLLERAAAHITRLAPDEAHAAARNGALVVDTRSDLDRERDGLVPGSLHIPHTVLAWRADPDSQWRSPYLGGLDERLIVMCDHGFSSVLAAANLADLGFTGVADVIGGFAAWRDAGLPVMTVEPRRRGLGERAGMTPPDA